MTPAQHYAMAETLLKVYASLRPISGSRTAHRYALRLLAEAQVHAALASAPSRNAPR